MGGGVREIFTVWGFDIDQKPLDKMEDRLRSMKETFFHLGEAILGVITGEGGGILGLGIAVAHTGAEARKMAQIVGVSVEKFQGLKAAASLSSVGVDSLSSSMRILSLHTLRAGQGSAESILAFAKAGFAVPSSLETTDKILMRIAARFHNMKDGIEKTGIATMLMGRGGAAMIPLLNKGPEEIQKMIDKATAYGAILDEKTIKAGKEFSDVTEEGKLAVSGLKNIIGAGLLPVLTELVQKALEWYGANRDLITQNINDFIRSAIPQVERLAGMVWHMTQMVWAAVNALGGLQNVFALVIAAFTAQAAFKAIGFFFEMAKAIRATIILLKTMSLWEAIATGGAAIVVQVAAAAAAGGLAWYLSRSGGDEATPGGMPSSPFSGGLPHSNSQHTTYQTFNPTMNIDFHGVTDPKQHSEIIKDELNKHLRKMSTNFLTTGK